MMPTQGYGTGGQIVTYGYAWGALGVIYKGILKFFKSSRDLFFGSQRGLHFGRAAMGAHGRKHNYRFRRKPIDRGGCKCS